MAVTKERTTLAELLESPVQKLVPEIKLYETLGRALQRVPRALIQNRLISIHAPFIYEKTGPQITTIAGSIQKLKLAFVVYHILQDQFTSAEKTEIREAFQEIGKLIPHLYIQNLVEVTTKDQLSDEDWKRIFKSQLGIPAILSVILKMPSDQSFHILNLALETNRDYLFLIESCMMDHATTDTLRTAWKLRQVHGNIHGLMLPIIMDHILATHDPRDLPLDAEDLREIIQSFISMPDSFNTYIQQDTLESWGLQLRILHTLAPDTLEAFRQRIWNQLQSYPVEVEKLWNSLIHAKHESRQHYGIHHQEFLNSILALSDRSKKTYRSRSGKSFHPSVGDYLKDQQATDLPLALVHLNEQPSTEIADDDNTWVIPRPPFIPLAVHAMVEAVIKDDRVPTNTATDALVASLNLIYTDPSIQKPFYPIVPYERLSHSIRVENADTNNDIHYPTLVTMTDPYHSGSQAVWDINNPNEFVDRNVAISQGQQEPHFLSKNIGVDALFYQMTHPLFGGGVFL